jgi:type IV pilus assembly protein PilM
VKLRWPGWRRVVQEEARVEERALGIGLDVGHRHLRLVYFMRQGRRLEKVVLVPLPPEDRERLSTLRGVLREAFAEAPPAEATLTLNMQGERVFTRYLQLPRLSGPELATAVPIEMEPHLPFRLEETMHGFVQGAALEGDPSRVGVTFVAAPRALFATVMPLLRELGIYNVSMEIPSFALARLAPGDEAGAFSALVEIGARYTHVGFARQGMVYYARDFPIAGDDFTDCLQKAQGFSRDYAELVKLEEEILGLPHRQAWLEPALTRWLFELRRTLHHFRYRLPGAPLSVARLVLSGGGSRLLGLEERLTQEMNLPVGRPGMVPLQGEETVLNHLAEHRPLLNVALGMAMRGREPMNGSRP